MDHGNPHRPSPQLRYMPTYVYRLDASRFVPTFRSCMTALPRFLDQPPRSRHGGVPPKKTRSRVGSGSVAMWVDLVDKHDIRVCLPVRLDALDMVWDGSGVYMGSLSNVLVVWSVRLYIPSCSSCCVGSIRPSTHRHMHATLSSPG